jgi:hypothetical protein
MSAAFEAALGQLGSIERNDLATMAIAKVIIGLAKEGERDAGRLCALACGQQLMQEFQPLCRQLTTEKIDPCRVAAGPGRLATRPSLTGSSGTPKTMGIVVVAAFRCNTSGPGDYGDLPMNQFSRQLRQSIKLILAPTVCDRYVLALDIAGLLQALAKSAQTVRSRLSRSVFEVPDHRQGCLLRARRERPSDCRAAEQRDELATFHSTSGWTTPEQRPEKRESRPSATLACLASP